MKTIYVVPLSNRGGGDFYPYTALELLEKLGYDFKEVDDGLYSRYPLNKHEKIVCFTGYLGRLDVNQIVDAIHNWKMSKPLKDFVVKFQNILYRGSGNSFRKLIKNLGFHTYQADYCSKNFIRALDYVDVDEKENVFDYDYFMFSKDTFTEFEGLVALVRSVLVNEKIKQAVEDLGD